MAVLSKPSKHAFFTEGNTLTEPEHKESCDVNRMIRDAHRGLQVRGGKPPKFGYDDTNMDAVQFRIQKQETEDYLRSIADGQLEEDDLKHIPDSIKKKFGFKAKTKPAQKPAQNDDELNNDEKSVTPAQTGPKPKSQKSSTGGTPPVSKPSESAAGD